MAGWHDFYEMIGGAAATLLGLLFVSVSLNAETILGAAHLHSRRLAEQAFQNYLAVLIVSLLVFFPTMSRIGFGNSVLWITVVWGFWSVYRVVEIFRAPVRGASLIRIVRRYLPSLIGFGLLIYSGFEMMTTKNDESVFCAVAVLLLIASATIVSWELLIQVAAEKYAPPRAGIEK